MTGTSRITPAGLLVGRFGALLACVVLALAVPVDEPTSTGVLARRLLLIAGILAATLATLAVRHTLRLPMNRRALLPWGPLGGVATVLLIVGQSHPLDVHTAFVTATLVRATVLGLAVRGMIDLVYGPVEDEATWGGTTAETATPEAMMAAEHSAVPEDALRPAWGRAPTEASGRRTPAELKLVSEDDDSEPSRKRHKRPSA